MFRPLTIVCVVGSLTLVLAAGLSLTLYLTRPSHETPPHGEYQREDTVVNCIPQGEETETECNRRNCIWREPTDGAPWCTFADGMGYTLDVEPEVTALGYRFQLRRIDNPGIIENSPDYDEITVDVEMHYDYRLRIKIYDREEARYQVPKEALNITTPEEPPNPDTRMYDVQYTNDPQFGLVVVRRDTGAAVFDITLPGLTFSEQYLQVTTRLPSPHVFGFGEHNHRSFKHDMEWKKWSIFTRDVAPDNEWNLYGAQPFYVNLEEDGNANGVFLLNSNALDVVLQPDPYPGISYHVIGGILDYYIFLGPSQHHVIQQYTEATGRPLMPPYWSLGFHLSRYDYNNLTYVKNIVDRNREAGIPQDVQYGDIDYMESYHDFTYDYVKYDGLPEFAKELHSRGQKYIIILDDFIGANETIFNLKMNGSYPPYSDGIEQGIFIMDPRDPSQPLYGEVWPGLSVYPDFTMGEKVHEWWKRHCDDFYYNWGVEYDALWIDMNEPANFVKGSTTGCDNNQLNNPPYVPKVLGAEENGGILYDQTICMDAPQSWGMHYDMHNLYGHSHSMVTFNTLREMFPGKRPFVLTRSNYAGTQSYATHWLGDNHSLWEHMHWSIIGILDFTLFGFSYVGADICGFYYDTTEELCQRWHQLGAFYPYSRNHNAKGFKDQDPAAFSEEMQRVTRDVLMTRYKLLPFLYTLMHEAHVYGNTVARPLVHEFSTDTTARIVDTQFLWGPSLMISPVLIEGDTWVEVYIPEGRWYDYYGGLEVENPGSAMNLSTPMDKINLHVRGGYIIPWQEPDNTTVFSRLNPMGLMVALGDAPNFQAYGNLFWDDGESFETYQNGNYLLLEFECSNNVLSTSVPHNGYADPNELKFETVNLLGLEGSIGEVIVNGEVLDADNIEYDVTTKAATLNNLGLDIYQSHVISWTYE